MRAYTDLAPWWHLFSHPDEYADEAAFYADQLVRAAQRPVRQVLELGCGGGNNAVHMQPRFEMTLTDIAPEMLDQSRKLNPDCPHHVGDMRTLRLDQRFDAVFVHDAVSYLTTPADLGALMGTVRHHLRPGGAVLLAPDDLLEHYSPGTEHGGHDEPDGSRGFRYLSWDGPLQPSDCGTHATADTDFAFLVRTRGRTRVVHETHHHGVFPSATWLGLAPGLRAVPHHHADGVSTVFVGAI